MKYFHIIVSNLQFSILKFYILGPRRPKLLDQQLKQNLPITGCEEDGGNNTAEEVVKVCTCGEASTPIEISSDEELERSMLELEEKISLEMSDVE